VNTVSAVSTERVKVYPMNSFVCVCVRVWVWACAYARVYGGGGGTCNSTHS
jgi:hypothetical protein